MRSLSLDFVLAAVLSLSSCALADTLTYTFDGTIPPGSLPAITITGSFSVLGPAIADGVITGDEVFGLSFHTSEGHEFFEESPTLVGSGLDVDSVTGAFTHTSGHQDFLSGHSTDSSLLLTVDAFALTGQGVKVDPWVDHSGGGFWTIIAEPNSIVLLACGLCVLGVARRLQKR
jgi:hypothetical protein